ncbi:MAG: hypothetical protein KJ052_15475, partial [Candidatus Hydrogenedentes bacterium]|nr:hypothetical protein [Candidatus Hydrogenedentota bacterium]
MTTVDIPQPVTVKEKAAVGAPKVAVVKTSPEKIFDDIAEVMVLADVEKHLPKDIPVILKDNISWHMPFLSANTTPWQLE